MTLHEAGAFERRTHPPRKAQELKSNSPQRRKTSFRGTVRAQELQEQCQLHVPLTLLPYRHSSSRPVVRRLALSQLQLLGVPEMDGRTMPLGEGLEPNQDICKTKGTNRCGFNLPEVSTGLKP